MNWRKVFVISLLAVGSWQGWQLWHLREVHAADGRIAPAVPLQSPLDNAAPIAMGRWTLTPRAQYVIEARVLGRERYSFDALSDLIPMDLALGWAVMSDNRILNEFEITQSARFYSWRPRTSMPIQQHDVVEHSANTHVIPADRVVAAALKRLRVGQVVTLSGQLVDAQRDDGTYIRTSLSRSDSGAGACEVLLVTGIKLR